jgi:hypothetical protein
MENKTKQNKKAKYMKTSFYLLRRWKGKGKGEVDKKE